MKSIYALSFTFLLLSIVSGAVYAIPDFPEIKIYVSKGQYTNLQTNSTEKLVLSNPVMLVNDDTTQVEEIHVRGNNSIKFKRKSLSVELDNPITLNADGKEIKLKKFNLLNLSMDKHLWHNRWSDINLENVGLFPLFNSYCKVWINDQPQGMYLLLEKPQQVRAKVNSPYMLRRGPDHAVSDEYFDESEKEAAKKYRKQFQSIYSSINTLEGDALAKQLQQVINLDNYFHFIAFNYLVMNGDYADEVFLYIEPKNQWFEVIPWDYDDILKPIPHEGRTERNRQFTHAKMFSLEESLDRAIAGNEGLYTLYEKSLKKMLLTLDSSALTSSANHVINELQHISQDKSMAKATLFLDTDPFEFDKAKEDILYALDFILARRKWILKNLK